MQLLFVINCAHFPLRRDKLHLKLITPNLRWALCDIRKLQKVRFAAVSEVEPLRTGAKWSQPSQAKPSWARPGPWVFGASQSVKICCQCCNLFIYFSSFFCKLLLLLLLSQLLLLLLLLCLVEHKNVQPTRRRTHWTSATCAHCLFHTLIGPQALLCAPLPSSPCSTCCCCSPAST